MFVVINIEIHVNKLNCEYKTAQFNELSEYNKVKVNLYKKQRLQLLKYKSM